MHYFKLTPDGRFIVYVSNTVDLLVGNGYGKSSNNIFLYDVLSGSIEETAIEMDNSLKNEELEEIFTSNQIIQFAENALIAYPI